MCVCAVASSSTFQSQKRHTRGTNEKNSSSRICCRHLKAFIFKVLAIERKATCNRSKSNSYVLHFASALWSGTRTLTPKSCSKPSLLIFFLFLLLLLIVFSFFMLSYVFFWFVSSPRVPRVCYSLIRLVIKFIFCFFVIAVLLSSSASS